MNVHFSIEKSRKMVKRRGGFTLLELLAVIAIIGVIAGFAVPALQSVTGGGNLSGAGSRVDNFLSGARQNSISKGVYTAVIVLTSPSTGGAYRTFSAFELAPKTDGSEPLSSDWRQVSKWEQLPEGIIVDNDPSRSCFLSNPLSGISPGLPSLNYQGRTLTPGTDYAYQIYTPSGRLGSAPSPCNLLLVSGYYEGASVTYTSRARANFYSFTFIDATGETKITRP